LNVVFTGTSNTPKGNIMTQQPDYLRMAEAARVQREQQALEAEEAKTRELEAVAGEAYLEFDSLFNSNLDHPVKLQRYSQATAALKGVSAPASGAPAASAVDDSHLPQEARQIIDMVRAEPDRFKIEKFGAVKDRDFTKLRKDSETPPASNRGANDNSSDAPLPAKKSAGPVPAKSAAAPKKAAEPAPDDTSESDGENPGLLGRIKAAGKAAVENAKQ
jgi:hypothetical protein